VTVFGPEDDLRHWPEPGGRMRDSLFWEMIMPDERLGLQIYLYLTDRGRVGYNVCVWGPEREPLVLDLGGGTVGADMDLDDFSFGGLTVKQPEVRRTAEVAYTSENVRLEYAFEAIHEAFSYHDNPDGLPSWFAANRLEQSGRVNGFLEIAGRRIPFHRRMGHRDHSWGKWVVAYTDSARAVNGWIWIARGEWGFAGCVVRDGRTVAVSTIEHTATYDDDMTQRRLDAVLVDVEGGRTQVVLDRYGLIKLPANAKAGTEIWESACDATIDGEPGAGQWETHWPTAYLEHLIASGS
jgi:hypothetical protein